MFVSNSDNLIPKNKALCKLGDYGLTNLIKYEYYEFSDSERIADVFTSYLQTCYSKKDIPKNWSSFCAILLYFNYPHFHSLWSVFLYKMSWIQQNHRSWRGTTIILDWTNVLHIYKLFSPRQVIWKSMKTS